MRCGVSMQRTARPGDSMLVVLPKLTEQSMPCNIQENRVSENHIS